MSNKTKLNRNKQFSLVRGEGKAKYLQGDKFFDFEGVFCGQVDPTFIPKKAVIKKERPLEPEKSKEEILAEAADKLDLDNLGTSSKKIVVGAVQQQQEDKKENAAALKAEEENA